MSEADFDQLEKFFKSWEEAAKDFEEKCLKPFLLEMALRAISRIKKRQAGQLGSPPAVDTGAMLNMWGIGSQNIVLRANTGTGNIEIDPEKSQIADVDVVGNSFEVVIWNGMDYASFIEFGARNRDGSWREGYFMMTISIDEVQRQIPQRFDKAFKTYIQSKRAV